MTLTDDDPPTQRDGKAGFSTICRAGNHRTCQDLQARCTCDCHGTPQRPPVRQEKPMIEATVTPLVRSYECDECDKSFASPNGLAIHAGRSHGGTKPSKPPVSKPDAPVKRTAPPEAVTDRELLSVLAVAYNELCGADVATCIESAGDLMEAISAAGWRVVPA